MLRTAEDSGSHRHARSGAIALLIWAPNLVWQVREGFPSMTYIANHRGSGGGPLAYFIEIVAYLFFLLPLWLAGLMSLFRTRLLCPIAIACTVPLLLFLFVGKSYYAAGTVPIALAQGLMALSKVKHAKRRRLMEIAVVIGSFLEFVAFAPLTLPVTPPERLHASGLETKNEVFADSVGWEDIAQQVTTVYANLPAPERESTVIISAYYGVPGALAIYGNPKQPPEVVSPQLSDYYWLPANLTATDALMVDYQPSDVAWMCTSTRLIGHLTVPYDVNGLEQGAPVTFCELNAPIQGLWPNLRNFS